MPRPIHIDDPHDNRPETTRWHNINDPVSPLDPIDHKSMFIAGKLPPRFILMLWTGKILIGPISFDTQDNADRELAYLKEQGNVVTHFLPIPKP